MMNPSTSAAAPTIADYELVRPIGCGSYGDVWLARGVTGLWRAIKIVWRDRFADAEPFEREFRGVKEFAAISLGESIQLALLHVGRNEPAGFFYYVMELADDAERGREIDPDRYVPLTLAKMRTQRGRLPPAECVAFGIAMARELASIHAHGLVHRDIKPSNVILVGGVPKLADVGLVSPINDARTFIGTEGFVPPEGPGSPAADVFALGKLLYELATGLDRSEYPRLPPDLGDRRSRRELSRLNRIILRACEPRPAQRYAHGGALLADLLTLQTSGQARRIGRAAKFALVVVGIALALAWGWSRFRSFKPSIEATASSPHVEPTIALPDLVELPIEKSVVVLPLDNLSADPEDAFFAAGIHAEIIATLGRIADLKVIGWRTALSYKGTSLSPAEIARQLGIGNVISGTVLRGEDRVRIHLEMRRPSQETPLWMNTYERKHSDSLGLQTAIAEDIARLLRARMSRGPTAGAGFMTNDARAFDLFLKMYALLCYEAGGADMASTAEAGIALMEEALAIDPNFMPAASYLSVLHALLCGNFERDPSKQMGHAAAAKKWAERAAQLVPGGAGYDALGYYYYMVEHDLRRALAIAEKSLPARPNDPGAYNLVAMTLFGMGRHDEADRWWGRAIMLDPRDLLLRLNQLRSLAELRRRDAWNSALAEYQTIAPAAQKERNSIAIGRFQLTGELPTKLDELPDMAALNRLEWLWQGRRFEEARMVIEAASRSPALNEVDRFDLLCRQWDVLQRLGRADDAVEIANDLMALAEKLKHEVEIDDSEKDGRLAQALMRIGRWDDAIAAGRRYAEVKRISDQQRSRWRRETTLAKVYAAANRGRECVTLLEQLLRVPSGLTVPMLRIDPDWDNLRDERQFQALLRDPKNDAPL